MPLKVLKSITQKYLICYMSIMLISCSFAPAYKNPELPVAKQYPREICTGKKCANIKQVGQQCFFTDPTLQQLIKLALENNRDLRKAIHRIEEARAQYEHQRADLFPTLNANAPGLRFRTPGDLLPALGGPFVFSAYLAAVSVISWEVDFWGRLRNLKDAALQNYLATEEAQHAVSISLIGQVANTYLIERELNELVNIAQKTVETRQKSYHLMKRRFEEGYSSKYELIQAETLLQDTKSDLTTLQRKREINWNAMTLLVGTQIGMNKGMLSQIEPYFIKGICPGLPSELLCNRPDILAAEHRLKAANANIGAAKAAFFPRISLTGAYGSASPELNKLFGSGSKFWAYAPNISVPIFDWGRNRSDLSLARARQNLAVTEYEHAIQVAFREVADALTNRSWLAKQIIIQKRALAAQKDRAHLAWRRYEFGSSPYLEVLDAERDKFSAEQTLVQTRLSFLASGVNLYTALGGRNCS